MASLQVFLLVVSYRINLQLDDHATNLWIQDEIKSFNTMLHGFSSVPAFVKESPSVTSTCFKSTSTSNFHRLPSSSTHFLCIPNMSPCQVMSSFRRCLPDLTWWPTTGVKSLVWTDWRSILNVVKFWRPSDDAMTSASSTCHLSQKVGLRVQEIKTESCTFQIL